MKTILICSVFIVSGLCFIAAGIYFLSEKYLKSLCENISDAEKKASQRMLGKIAGYFSYSIGSLTLICGILFALMPGLKYFIALFYMILLALGICILTGFFGKKK